ncbi:VOC family protein [Streptococcus uberis]|uniref:VOC family protein n=1 Tax=Streptococcus uberis TaxID=1349 RepID=UPI003D772914
MNRINIICLGVRNMAHSVSFYRDGLGFETKESNNNPEVIFFQNDGPILELYPKEPSDVSWGGFHAYFADPDAYVWEVCWNPTMPLDEMNRVQV